MEEKQQKGKRLWALVSTGLIVMGAAILLYQADVKRRADEAMRLSQYQFNRDWSVLKDLGQEKSNITILAYPTDKLFITQERADYADGAMILKVPKLDLEVPVMNGDDLDTLKKGVGLYRYSQLPSVYNSNVSIAGHRDIHGKEFYYIDTLTQGDQFSLVYNGTEYVYQYENTVIVNNDDWSPIYCSDYSKITLTSCDPIGTTLHRIVVTGKLVEVTTLN